MNKGRMEAFSDGVIAIIITIMVLEMKVPHGDDFESLRPLLPVFGSYVMSFAYIGIYWNNHHHLLRAVQHVNGATLWANLHLLFWLSLFPFVTGWMGENNFAPRAVGLYGVVLFLAAVAYSILVHILIHAHGKDSKIAVAIGRDIKGNISMVFYAAGIGLSFYMSWIAVALYVLVAAIWFIPDKRIERVMEEKT
jgi:uncharacterized membrane protein